MVIVCLPLLASEVASSLQHKTSFVLLIAISSAISVNSGFALIYVFLSTQKGLISLGVEVQVSICKLTDY